MRYALHKSLASVRHDFFSSSRVRLRKRDRPLPTHDLSSRTYDRIHPILLVEALVASVQKSRIHRVLGGGKLLH